MEYFFLFLFNVFFQEFMPELNGTVFTFDKKKVVKWMNVLARRKQTSQMLTCARGSRFFVADIAH